MINAAHTIVYAEDAALARAFFRDVIGWKHVDDGGGWLIFQQPPTELGIHETGPDAPAGHELFLMCDDVDATVAELRAKGVEFEGEVTDQGWGRLITMHVPGAGKMGLYQPAHRSPLGMTGD
ncbi:MAG TPA: VOC family protein [Frankiaceae bacterium]|nr:VOC family protein [Frankiaceae bacterium]